MPDVKLSELAVTSPSTVAAGATLWTHKGHIDGLQLEWLSNTGLRVTSGSAYIEGLGYAVEVATAIDNTGLSLTANTWHHLYLFDNAGTPDIEITTTAPAAAYSGTARSKAGDSSRRYMGSVRTKAGAAEVIQFIWSGGGPGIVQRYVSSTESTSILSGGTATSVTTVSAATLIPVTSRIGFLRLNNNGNQTVGVANPESEGHAAPSTGLLYLAAGVQAYVDFALDVNQQINYWFVNAPTSGDLKCNAMGFILAR